MVNKPLEIHPEALAEFKAAVTWYLDRSESAAVNFVAEIDNAIELITASPRRWPSAEPGARKFVLQRFPYAIVYRERILDVQVLAIAHGHRRPEYWKKQAVRFKSQTPRLLARRRPLAANSRARPDIL
jgi:toxin ParE1/3/4